MDYHIKMYGCHFWFRSCVHVHGHTWCECMQSLKFMAHFSNVELIILIRLIVRRLFSMSKEILHVSQRGTSITMFSVNIFIIVSCDCHLFSESAVLELPSFLILDLLWRAFEKFPFNRRLSVFFSSPRELRTPDFRFDFFLFQRRSEDNL